MILHDGAVLKIRKTLIFKGSLDFLHVMFLVHYSNCYDLCFLNDFFRSNFSVHAIKIIKLVKQTSLVKLTLQSFCLGKPEADCDIHCPKKQSCNGGFK